jgi:hypothetical protein
MKFGEFLNKTRLEVVQQRAIAVYERDQAQAQVDAFDRQLEGLNQCQELADRLDATNAQEAAAAKAARKRAAAAKAEEKARAAAQEAAERKQAAAATRGARKK